MLDNRIYTFLTLCEQMNYRATAEVLLMTQPAVTQHIQGLERDYDCKLFEYNNRVLIKTEAANRLESCARAALYNDNAFRKSLDRQNYISMKIGATKTIGRYVIPDKISHLLSNDKIRLSVFIDNTATLLGMLDHAKLDFAIVEGYFDRQKYGYKLMKKEEFVGICPKTHRFAGKHVSIEDMKHELLLLREPASGTRAIFEQMLARENYSIGFFDRVCEISNFELMKHCLVKNSAITFAYKSVADSAPELASFSLSGELLIREFNYVYLKNSMSHELLDLFFEI